MSRILWLAVADARGHLMRAHRARELLRASGVTVDIMTTTAAGVRFLEELGSPSFVLGRGYTLSFDGRQNLARGATNRRLLQYLSDPTRCFADVRSLVRLARHYDLVVDDSFHPAAFVAPLFIAADELPLVHVYGTSLLRALTTFHERHVPPGIARLYRRAVQRLCRSSFARIEHTLSGPIGASPTEPNLFRLRPLLDAPGRAPSVVRSTLDARGRLVVAYLNPHFNDEAIAQAIEDAAAGATLWAVGEGFGDRPGWHARDPNLGEKITAADVVISAPGMATTAAVLLDGVPFVALLSAQPEQLENYETLKRIGPACTSSVDVREGVADGAFRRAVENVMAIAAPSRRRSSSRVAVRHAWRDTILQLIAQTKESTLCTTNRPTLWSSKPTISPAPTPAPPRSFVPSTVSCDT